MLAVDPAGAAGSMPSTVGAWARQLPAWLPPEAVVSRFRPLAVTADGRERVLDEYVVLDTGVLAGLGGFDVIEGSGVAGSGVTVEWDGAGRSRRWAGPAVSLLDGGGASPSAPAELPEEWTSPDVLVDASPTDRPLPVLQLAVGHVFAEADVPAAHRRPVLMDFTVPASAGPGVDATDAAPASGAPDAGPASATSPASAENADGFPATFSYRLPLGDGRWLIEETILVVHVRDGAHLDALFAGLRRRQVARLDVLGVDPGAAVGEELIRFPVGPADLPSNRPRTPLAERLRGIPVGRGVSLDLSRLVPWSGAAVPGLAAFGAAGGWMHPATGYSVGAVLADVDRVLDRVASRDDASPPGGRPLAWLRRRGLAVLLRFDARATRDFFGCFFRLPAPFIRAYLTGGSPLATLGVMVSLAVPLALRSPRTLGLLLRGFVRRLPV
ncbi:lycopene cyclase family protein [Corynebacterium sp. 335C]